MRSGSSSGSGSSPTTPSRRCAPSRARRAPASGPAAPRRPPPRVAGRGSPTWCPARAKPRGARPRRRDPPRPRARPAPARALRRGEPRGAAGRGGRRAASPRLYPVLPRDGGDGQAAPRSLRRGPRGRAVRPRRRGRPLRACAPGDDPSGRAWLLAATDPANPYGAMLPWPAPRSGARGSLAPRGGRVARAGRRRAGALPRAQRAAVPRRFAAADAEAGARGGGADAAVRRIAGGASSASERSTASPPSPRRCARSSSERASARTTRA